MLTANGLKKKLDKPASDVDKLLSNKIFEQILLSLREYDLSLRQLQILEQVVKQKQQVTRFEEQLKLNIDLISEDINTSRRGLIKLIAKGLEMLEPDASKGK